MRFFISLFFLAILGLAVGFGAVAMLDMPAPEEHFEVVIDNSVLHRESD